MQIYDRAIFTLLCILCRMSTHCAQADALGGRETGEFQAVEPIGESTRQERLQVPRETTEHSRLQQAQY